MWFQYRAAIFGMELSSDKPFQLGHFYNFYQSRFRIDSGAFHSGSFVLFFVFVVEFITMAMTLLDVF